MTLVIKKVSDQGTTNPIVARLGVQTSEIIDFFHLKKKQRDQVCEAYFNHVMPRLIKCDEITKSITEESEAIKTDILNDNLTTQSHGRVIELPQIKELVERSESFLYNAKSALRDIALIFDPLFGEQFSHSRYNKIRELMEKKYGTDAPIVRLLSDDESWIKHIVDMRNAIEHPSSEMGPLHVINFELLKTNDKGQRFFREPAWFFDGEKPSSITIDMEVFTDNILRFAEDLLVVSYLHLHPDSIVVFTEIPEQDRRQECPVRLKADIDKSRLKPNNASQPDV